MSVYLDASLLVAAFTIGDFSERAEAYTAKEETFIVSEFAVAEFSAAVARKVRQGDLTKLEAEQAFEALDRWISSNDLGVGSRNEDVESATRLIRSLDHNVLAPDALHIVAALRLGSAIATFDQGMIKVATALGLAVAHL